MKTCWELLDLEPTSEIRLIKKHYALKLKAIDQDLEPVRFQQLHEAFLHCKQEAEFGSFKLTDHSPEFITGEQRTNPESEPVTTEQIAAFHDPRSIDLTHAAVQKNIADSPRQRFNEKSLNI